MLVKPNGITVYSNSQCLVLKDVFYSLPATILMSLYILYRSYFINHFPTLILASNSLMSGSEHLLGIVSQFRGW